MRLIDADDLWSDIMMLPHNGDMISSEEVEQAIKDAATIDPESLRKKGEWINERQLVGGFQDVWGCDCSNCRETIKIDTKKPKFCPECGADMRKEAHNEC